MSSALAIEGGQVAILDYVEGEQVAEIPFLAPDAGEALAGLEQYLVNWGATRVLDFRCDQVALRIRDTGVSIPIHAFRVRFVVRRPHVTLGPRGFVPV